MPTTKLKLFWHPTQCLLYDKLFPFGQWKHEPASLSSKNCSAQSLCTAFPLPISDSFLSCITEICVQPKTCGRSLHVTRVLSLCCSFLTGTLSYKLQLTWSLQIQTFLFILASPLVSGGTLHKLSSKLMQLQTLLCFFSLGDHNLVFSFIQYLKSIVLCL